MTKTIPLNKPISSPRNIRRNSDATGHRMLALVKTVERSQHWLQCRSLDLPRLRHGRLALFGMRLPFRPALALGLQPAIELVEAGEPQPGLKEAAPDRLPLILDLALLPYCRRRAGGRLDHIMVGHDQEPPVDDPLLASEHAPHRGLHFIVDAAARHTSKEDKAARMRVEQHLLALARIRPDIDRSRCIQPLRAFLFVIAGWGNKSWLCTAAKLHAGGGRDLA